MSRLVLFTFNYFSNAPALHVNLPLLHSTTFKTTQYTWCTMHLHRFLGNPFYYALTRFIVSRHFPEHQQKALKRLQLLLDGGAHTYTRRTMRSHTHNTCVHIRNKIPFSSCIFSRHKYSMMIVFARIWWRNITGKLGDYEGIQKLLESKVRSRTFWRR